MVGDLLLFVDGHEVEFDLRMVLEGEADSVSDAADSLVDEIASFTVDFLVEFFVEEAIPGSDEGLWEREFFVV